MEGNNSGHKHSILSAIYGLAQLIHIRKLELDGDSDFVSGEK